MSPKNEMNSASDALFHKKTPFHIAKPSKRVVHQGDYEICFDDVRTLKVIEELWLP